MYKQILLYFASFIIIVASTHATTLDEAKDMYRAGDYISALPVFQSQLKKKPKDASLNHWYGVCLYQTGEIEQAKPYLEYAHKKKVVQAPLYLAEIAFLEYRVDDADEYLADYCKAMEKAKKEIPAEAETLSKRIGQMRAMLDRVEQIEIIDSIAVDTDTFFKAYRITAESGSLNSSDVLPKGTEFASPTVVYMPESKASMLWATPDENENYILVSSSQLSDGQWEYPRPLGDNLNEGGDANFPFLMSDGVTLYFANTGENSIGGYDIFISRKDETQFLQPQNIGMPYNSPYDDYMLAIDEITGVGWWATDRNNHDGKITIYKFIPKDMRVNYAIDNPDLRNLAHIKSIRDTWQADADYSEILSAIKEIDPTRKIVKKDFTFAMPRGRIYTTWDDFSNPDAREAMEEYLDACKEHDAKKAKLENLRRQYATGDTDCAEEIKSLEKDVRKGYIQLRLLSNKVRKLEH